MKRIKTTKSLFPFPEFEINRESSLIGANWIRKNCGKICLLSLLVTITLGTLIFNVYAILHFLNNENVTALPPEVQDNVYNYTSPTTAMMSSRKMIKKKLLGNASTTPTASTSKSEQKMVPRETHYDANYNDDYFQYSLD